MPYRLELVFWAILAGLHAGCLACLAFLWKEWKSALRAEPLSALRRTVANFGLFAVAAQVASLAAAWALLCGSLETQGLVFFLAAALFLIAATCSFAMSGWARVWLLASTFILLILNFLVAAAHLKT